jgi:hypothetical protein
MYSLGCVLQPKETAKKDKGQRVVDPAAAARLAADRKEVCSFVPSAVLASICCCVLPCAACAFLAALRHFPSWYTRVVYLQSI